MSNRLPARQERRATFNGGASFETSLAGRRFLASIRGDFSIKSRAVYAIARGRLALNRCEIAILPVPDPKPDAGLTDFEPGSASLLATLRQVGHTAIIARNNGEPA